MAWTDNSYPTAPDFPTAHEDLPMVDDFYNQFTSYIEDMVTPADSILDASGNIELGATKGIFWDSTERIDLSGGEIKVTALSVVTFRAQDATLATLTVTGVCSCATLVVDGDLDVTGSIVSVDGTVRDYQKLTKTATPAAATTNTAKLWLSSGVGYGDNGDFVCDIKANDGGQTNKNFTLMDYSGL